jgi:DNA-binding FadR family transcriptional regulator
MSELGGLIRSLAGRAIARNFHTHVIGELGYRIVSGQYPVGSSLPGDAEMIAEFDVSRTVLREVLKSIESKGLVEARPKIGTKVSPRSRWNHFDNAVIAWQFRAGIEPARLRQITDIRLAIEPMAAADVVSRKVGDDLRMLHYWLKQMENARQSPLNFAIADFEFHLIIADISKNEFLRSLMGLVELGHCCVYDKMVARDLEIPIELLRVHSDLLLAIESGVESKVSKAIGNTILMDYKLAQT